VIAKGLFNFVQKRYNLNTISSKRKVYISIIGVATFSVIGYAYSTFKERVRVLDRKYFPIYRFIKYKELGVEFIKI